MNEILKVLDIFCMIDENGHHEIIVPVDSKMLHIKFYPDDLGCSVVLVEKTELKGWYRMNIGHYTNAKDLVLLIIAFENAE